MITLVIRRKDVQLIQQELNNNKPYEACGVLIGNINDTTVNVERAQPITNVRHSRTSFELDSEEFYKVWNDAEKKGKEIVGIYHTHPVSSAVPSLWDRETMQNVTNVWLIAGVDGMRAYVWNNGVKSVKLKEIP